MTFTTKKQMAKKQRGATMVEYAIMIGLIAVVAIGVISGIGTQTNKSFSTVNSSLTSANG